MRPDHHGEACTSGPDAFPNPKAGDFEPFSLARRSVARIQNPTPRVGACTPAAAKNAGQSGRLAFCARQA